MMMMTMMTNTIPYRRTKTHILDKVLMGIWVHPVNRTTTMMTMMKNMLMTASTLAAYAANQVQCDALYQCLAGVVPDRCGCCQVPLNVTTIIIFFSVLMASYNCSKSNLISNLSAALSLSCGKVCAQREGEMCDPGPADKWDPHNCNFQVRSKNFKLLEMLNLVGAMKHCRVGCRHIWPYLTYLGAYLGARNMVKWGVPEKILQNAVQTRWS